VIELVIFDMDGVLSRLDRARRLELLSEMTGRTPAFLQKVIWDSDFESGAELGTHATGEEHLAEWNRRTGCGLVRADWVRARHESMTPDPEVLAIATAVQRHCGIAMLSNNNPLLYEELETIFPEAFRLFGGRAHASFQFRARKPDRAVFERLIARYGVAPQRAVFVDDEPNFVAGARQAGLHAIDYTGAAELRRRLRGLGVRFD
jgi:glucose-1-phosphatase